LQLNNFLHKAIDPLIYSLRGQQRPKNYIERVSKKGGQYVIKDCNPPRGCPPWCLSNAALKRYQISRPRDLYHFDTQALSDGTQSAQTNSNIGTSKENESQADDNDDGESDNSEASSRSKLEALMGLLAGTKKGKRKEKERTRPQQDQKSAKKRA